MTDLSRGEGARHGAASATHRPATHRIGDEILAGYVAGTLPEAFGLVIAAQASLCPETQARLHDLEAIGGALLDDGPQAAMGDDALEAVLRRIAEAEDAPDEAAPESAPAPDCNVL